MNPDHNIIVLSDSSHPPTPPITPTEDPPRPFKRMRPNPNRPNAFARSALNPRDDSRSPSVQTADTAHMSPPGELPPEPDRAEEMSRDSVEQPVQMKTEFVKAEQQQSVVPGQRDQSFSPPALPEDEPHPIMTQTSQSGPVPPPEESVKAAEPSVPGESSPTDKDDSGVDKSAEDEEEVEEQEEEPEMNPNAMRQYEYDQVAKLNPTQLRRYEQYRRSDLKLHKVKRVLISINPVLAKSNELYFVAVKGLAKLFVGDMIETALQVGRNLGHKGAVTPQHLREAYRILRRDGKIPSVADRDNFL